MISNESVWEKISLPSQWAEIADKTLIIGDLRSTKIRDLARQAEGIVSFRRAIQESDDEHGFLVIGQAIGMIDKVVLKMCSATY